MFGRLKVLLKLLGWKRTFDREVKMGWDPKIGAKKAGKALLLNLLSVIVVAVIGALSDPEFVTRVFEGNVPPAILAIILPAVAALAEALRNWVKHSKFDVFGSPGPFVFLLLALGLPASAQTTTYYDGCNTTTCDGTVCGSTTLYCGSAGTLKATLPAMPGGDAPASTPKPRTYREEPIAGLWVAKSVTVPEAGWDARSDYFGGRMHARIPLALQGRLAIIGRGDVLSMPGSNPFKDFGSIKALEVYGGLEGIFASKGRFDFGAAAVYGATIPFANGVSTAVEEDKELYAGGLVVHELKTGAWAALLIGQYDAAGPGTRLIGSVHFPIKAGFAFLVDYVSGDGGWLRPGVAYGVSF